MARGVNRSEDTVGQGADQRVQLGRGQGCDLDTAFGQGLLELLGYHGADFVSLHNGHSSQGKTNRVVCERGMGKRGSSRWALS